MPYPRFVFFLRLQITDPKEHEPLYSSFANDRIFRDPLIRKEKPDVSYPPCAPLAPKVACAPLRGLCT